MNAPKMTKNKLSPEPAKMISNPLWTSTFWIFSSQFSEKSHLQNTLFPDVLNPALYPYKMGHFDAKMPLI